MWRIFVVLILFFGMANVGFAQKAKATKKGPIFKFDQELIQLGKVKRGETRNFEFKFTNAGDEDLQIDIVSSCSCTTVDYPVKKIKPNEKGVLKVTFDSTEKEKSETVDVDIYLKNTNPKTGSPILKIVQYSFELTK